jgi:hypothetical protein
MSVPEHFIRRPVMTTLVMAGILLFGVIGFRQLPVSDLPNVDYPTIQFQPACPAPARNDGLRRGDAAGKTIVHHRGRGFDVVGQFARLGEHHHAVHARPAH